MELIAWLTFPQALPVLEGKLYMLSYLDRLVGNIRTETLAQFV
jgi:hypothetical protein